MDITGKLKVINETLSFGSNGFRKREVVVTTEEQYPQIITIEFTKDNCDLLNSFQVGQDVKIGINILGREWINPEGVPKYFNSIQGWRIKKTGNYTPPVKKIETDNEEEDNDMPF